MYESIVVFGATGAIGGALIKEAAIRYPKAVINGVGRKESSFNGATYHQLKDFTDETALQALAEKLDQQKPVDLIIIATGVLHDGEMMPEKTMKALSVEQFEMQFRTNSILPAMIAKHFLPKLDPTKKSTFAALSARVGSISDNKLGGWYSYRASKAALNMMLKNLAIEHNRKHAQHIIIGIHPGTVDSKLSGPFQKEVTHTIFTPSEASRHILDVIESTQPEQSGEVLAWDGSAISP